MLETRAALLFVGLGFDIRTSQTNHQHTKGFVSMENNDVILALETPPRSRPIISYRNETSCRSEAYEVLANLTVCVMMPRKSIRWFKIQIRIRAGRKVHRFWISWDANKICLRKFQGFSRRWSLENDFFSLCRFEFCARKSHKNSSLHNCKGPKRLLQCIPDI